MLLKKNVTLRIGWNWKVGACWWISGLSSWNVLQSHRIYPVTQHTLICIILAFNFLLHFVRVYSNFCKGTLTLKFNDLFLIENASAYQISSYENSTQFGSEPVNSSKVFCFRSIPKEASYSPPDPNYGGWIWNIPLATRVEWGVSGALALDASPGQRSGTSQSTSCEQQ